MDAVAAKSKLGDPRGPQPPFYFERIGKMIHFTDSCQILIGRRQLHEV